jgi:hypothetical protein
MSVAFLLAKCGAYFAQWALIDPPPAPEEAEIMWADFSKTLKSLREADDEAATHSVLEAFVLGVAMARECEPDPDFPNTILRWSQLTLKMRVEGFPASWASPPTSSEPGQ